MHLLQTQLKLTIIFGSCYPPPVPLYIIVLDKVYCILIGYHVVYIWERLFNWLKPFVQLKWFLRRITMIVKMSLKQAIES